MTGSEKHEVGQEGHQPKPGKLRDGYNPSLQGYQPKSQPQGKIIPPSAGTGAVRLRIRQPEHIADR